jgi:transposase-like protein
MTDDDIDVMQADNINKGGKPSLYRPAMLPVIQQAAAEGIVIKEIARALNIAESTLYNWKKDIPEVKEAFERGEEYIVNDVKMAIYKRALGYEYNEVTKENGSIKKEVTKHIPGDTTAQQVVLYNKLSDEFKSKNHVDSLTLIQNNYQLPQIQQQIQQLEQELKNLETIETVALEVTVQD